MCLLRMYVVGDDMSPLLVNDKLSALSVSLAGVTNRYSTPLNIEWAADTVCVKLDDLGHGAREAYQLITNSNVP
jgi:hypothetical protein